MAICFNKVANNVVRCLQQGRGNCCMVSLCNKFGNGLTGLNHVVFCNLNFIWVKSADKIVQMAQTWFRKFTQTTWFKTTTWVRTLPAKSNQRADVSFLLSEPGNYKDYLDFQKSCFFGILGK